MSSFSFEPISALSSFFLVVRMAKLSDSSLRASIDALEQRTKQVRSTEKATWLALYREALELLDRVASGGEGRSSGAGAAPRSINVGSVVMQLQSALQRVGADWAPRLASQERDVLGEAEKAVDKLALESRFDENLGELVYAYGEAPLRAFHEWLVAAEKRWVENNEALVARRANEALVETTSDLPPGTEFEVKPAELRMARREPPRLKGNHVPRPGLFQSVGASYRLVMSAATGVSGLAYVLSKVELFKGSVSRALPVVSFVILLAAIAFAAVTIPRERRQACARLEARSLEIARRELLELVRARLKLATEEQRAAIQRHLAAEGRRAAIVLRGIGSAPELGAAAPASLGGGLMPNDLARMRGEWREAVERRIAELAAEVGVNQETA